MPVVSAKKICAFRMSDMVRAFSLVLLAGCSFLFTSEVNTPNCSVSRAAPIADTVVASVATAALIAGVGIFGGCSSEGENAPCLASASLLMLPGLVLAAATWPSAAVGYQRAASCASRQLP
jgi:hypothetical protein